MRVDRVFSAIEPHKWPARTRLAVGVALAGLVVLGSLAAFPQRPLAVSAVQSASIAPDTASDVAQGTLPLPAPGTSPSPPPPPSSADAKAHAALLAAKANVDVTDAWARATPANATTAQIYLNLVSAKDADKLAGAETAMATKVELQEDAKPGMAAAADIPGGATVSFSPQGRHLTLVGLKAPLSEGDSFLLTLKFDKAGTQSTTVKILSPTATGLAPPASTRTGDTTATVSQR